MQYFILIVEGMADFAIEQLQGKTPLEAARTPHLDSIARRGKLGVVRTVPAGMRPDSEIAMLSLLGYDPQKSPVGRAPLEAAAFGIKLAPGQMAFVCSLVTADDSVLADYCAGRIGSKEAAVLISCLQEHLSSPHISFHPGASFRHILIYSGEEMMRVTTVPPHDVIGRNFGNYIPYGEGSQALRRLIFASRDLLGRHEINMVRADLGENPANMIWLWGQGYRPDLQPFKEKYGKRGIVITNSALWVGLAKLIGWDCAVVPDALEQKESDYAAKCVAALKAMPEYDIVLVHLRAADIASHDADPLRKVVAIENADEKILGPVLQTMEKLPKHRILVASSHFSPVLRRSHSADPAPFAIFGTGIHAIREVPFTERDAKGGDLQVEDGHDLMEYFLHEEPMIRKMRLPGKTN